MSVIVVEDLRKSYKHLEAVRGISFAVAEGQVFALLGPNGAGKTTTVEICEGFRRRTSGRVEVLGHDPARGGGELKSQIGIVLQSTGIDLYLTVAETIELYRAYYPSPRPIDEIIEIVGLQEKRDSRVGKLSGGQQRRLDLAIALAGDPKLFFLDEPTTGFDPAARRGAWEIIKNLAALGKTIFLTTHYMDEAQYLADMVAIIAKGEIVARGHPSELGGRKTAASKIRFRPDSAEDDLSSALGLDVRLRGGYAEVLSDDPTSTLHKLTGWALDRGLGLNALEVSRPSLEDVYLELTGGEAGAEE